MGQSRLHGNTDIPSHFHGWIGMLESVLSNKGLNFRMTHLHCAGTSEPTPCAAKGNESKRCWPVCRHAALFSRGVASGIDHALLLPLQVRVRALA